jgi:hypothetical protein
MNDITTINWKRLSRALPRAKTVNDVVVHRDSLPLFPLPHYKLASYL